MDNAADKTVPRGQQFKYSQYLNGYLDCPPQHFATCSLLAFRWVHAETHPNDFLPTHLISEPPPRMLDDNERMCMGYGLSMFVSLETACTTYSKAKSRQKATTIDGFLQRVGDSVAELELNLEDGVSDQANATGHFTFHEFEGIDLYQRIKLITLIEE